MTNERTAEDQERADFLETLSTRRSFLRHAVRDLTDEQARQRTTVSELCLGGLVKHVTRVERRWADFIVRGPQAMSPGGEEAMKAHADGFRMLEGETLAGLLDDRGDRSPHRRSGGLVAFPSTPRNLFPRPLGSLQVPGGPPRRCCCTCLPRRPSMPATPTSSGSPSTAQRRWADHRRRGGSGTTAGFLPDLRSRPGRCGSTRHAGRAAPRR